MWKRSELKKNAKEALRRNYWKAFVVSLIATGLSGSMSGLNLNLGGSGSRQIPNNNGFNFNFDSGIVYSLLAIVAVVVIVAIAVVLIFAALSYLLSLGEARFYVSANSNDADMSLLAHAFKKDRFLNVIKVLFIKDLYVEVILFLSVCVGLAISAALLFMSRAISTNGIIVYDFPRYFMNNSLAICTCIAIILASFMPGLIKSYQLSMVKYIVADNTKIGLKRAFHISKQLTNGNKWRIFVLDLSFIGWFLLGLLACGIGVIFVQPYYKATKAQLYLHLRNEALTGAAFHPEEFSLTLQLPSGDGDTPVDDPSDT